MAALTNPRFSTDPTLIGVAAGGALLRKGAKGDGVLRVQEALRDMGFNLKAYVSGGASHGGPDGAWGGQTDAAILNFQRHAARFFSGIADDGVLGARTLAALDALAPFPGAVAWAEGQPCKLPPGAWEGQPLRVVCVLNEHRTFLFDEGGALEKIYPNASGKAGSRTDPGLKRVDGLLNEAEAKATGVRLYGDGTVFGPRIVGLSWADGRHSGEELHGTNRPDQMGMFVSHGCVRHYNEDILPLWDRLKVGDRVAIVEHIDDRHLGGGLTA